MKVCMFCGEPLRFINGRGWVHLQGGMYYQRCERCGWKGAPYPPFTKCPRCGSEEVVDDHCAHPVERKTYGSKEGDD